jgi:circadian clock protein KaiB
MSDANTFRFRLYIAGTAPNSVLALQNLQSFCREFLPGAHEIEVVDVVKDPQRALKDGVFMTPTLQKLAPAPFLQIVGSLTDRAAVLAALGVEVAQ